MTYRVARDMNSRERVIKAFEGKIPDIVPHFEVLIDTGIIDKLLPGKDLFDFVDIYDIDAISIKYDLKVEKIDENTYLDERGLILKRTPEDYLQPIEPIIKNEKDLRKFEFPDPNKEYRFDTLRKAVDRFKNNKAIVIRLKDGWSEARDLHGYSETLIDLIDNPKLINGIIQKSVEYYSELGKQAANIGADIVFTGDDIAGTNGLLMTPQHFKELLYPAMKKLYKNFHDYGLYVLKHSDGNLNEIMDLLVDTGLDCLNPIDPLAGMDLQKIKEKYGKKICIMGNVNCAGNLVYGEESDVIEEVKNCIEIGSPGGGYILSSSNSIHSSVKPNNYIALMDTVKKYGKY
jgi:uroporphyrinogen decarboxylase